VARLVDQEFDCGERWVWVDRLVCRLVYASCHCTTWEKEKGVYGLTSEVAGFWGLLVGMRHGGVGKRHGA